MNLTPAGWIAGLTSGRFQQSSGQLHPPAGGFCCLGVAANLIDADAWAIQFVTVSGLPVPEGDDSTPRVTRQLWHGEMGKLLPVSDRIPPWLVRLLLSTGRVVPSEYWNNDGPRVTPGGTVTGVRRLGFEHVLIFLNDEARARFGHVAEVIEAQCRWLGIDLATGAFPDADPSGPAPLVRPLPGYQRQPAVHGPDGDPEAGPSPVEWTEADYAQWIATGGGWNGGACPGPVPLTAADLDVTACPATSAPLVDALA